MGRRNRQHKDAEFHHVYFRGINREPIVRDDEDKREFLSFWERYAQCTGVRTLCWSLLDTHAHGTIASRIAPVSIFFQCTLSQYAKWFNKKWGRFGNLFCDRFRSVPIADSEHLRVACRYVLLNPVKAGSCRLDQLPSYPWTNTPDLLNPSGSRFESLDRETVTNLFAANSANLHTPLFSWLEAKTARDDLGSIFYGICIRHGVSAAEIRRGSRALRATAARKDAAKMMRHQFGMATSEIGTFLQCSPRCVRKLLTERGTEDQE